MRHNRIFKTFLKWLAVPAVMTTMLTVSAFAISDNGSTCGYKDGKLTLTLNWTLKDETLKEVKFVWGDSETDPAKATYAGVSTDSTNPYVWSKNYSEEDNQTATSASITLNVSASEDLNSAEVSPTPIYVYGCVTTYSDSTGVDAMYKTEFTVTEDSNNPGTYILTASDSTSINT